MELNHFDVAKNSLTSPLNTNKPILSYKNKHKKNQFTSEIKINGSSSLQPIVKTDHQEFIHMVEEHISTSNDLESDRKEIENNRHTIFKL